MWKLSFFTGLLILLFAPACKKDQTVDNISTRLTQIVYERANWNDTTVFNYDAKNRLTSIAFTATRNTITIEYDAQGRLLKKRGPGYIDSFVYDSNNLIKERINTPLIYQLAGYSSIYEYDGSGRLIADSSVTFYPNGYRLAYGNGFAYDAKGNVTQVRHFSSDGAVYGTSFYKYDDNPNPLSSGYYISFFEALSKNNLIQDIFQNINYSYEYYSNKLPKKQTKDRLTYPGDYHTANYFYE